MNETSTLRRPHTRRYFVVTLERADGATDAFAARDEIAVQRAVLRRRAPGDRGASAQEHLPADTPTGYRDGVRINVEIDPSRIATSLMEADEATFWRRELLKRGVSP